MLRLLVSRCSLVRCKSPTSYDYCIAAARHFRIRLTRFRIRLQRHKLSSRLIDGEERKVLAVIGNVGTDVRELALMPGVAEVIRVGKPFKLASREGGESTLVSIGNVQIGGPQLVVMAGPCSVESREGFFLAAQQVRDGGAQVLRGGAFKPRTSPYAFQGMGKEGLEILAEARERFGLPVVTEVVSPAHVELVSGICRFTANRRPEHAELRTPQGGLPIF